MTKQQALWPSRPCGRGEETNTYMEIATNLQTTVAIRFHTGGQVGGEVSPCAGVGGNQGVRPARAEWDQARGASGDLHIAFHTVSLAETRH